MRLGSGAATTPPGGGSTRPPRGGSRRLAYAGQLVAGRLVWIAQASDGLPAITAVRCRSCDAAGCIQCNDLGYRIGARP